MSDSPLRGSGLQDRGLERIGDTVRRPTGPWTGSVHHLLRHIREQGFDLAPEPIGVDSTGREILSWIEGRDQGWPFIPEIESLAGAQHLGELVTRLRTAVAEYECPPRATWQFATGAPTAGQSMQHGDLGPWNLLWGRDGQVAGVLDWDFAQPGDPWYDTGHLAWFTVPLMDDDRALARGFAKPPDRLPRLDAFATGAGLTRAEVIDIALATQAEYERRVITRGRDGGPWALFYEKGLHENSARDRAWTSAKGAPWKLRAR